MDTQTALATIDRGLDFTAIDRANLQPTTKAKYRREIENLVQAQVNSLDHNALTAYADGLKSSRKAFLKSALRLMFLEFEQAAKAGATPRNVASIQAGLYRLEAMRDAVKVKPHKGTKAHTWLSQKQVTEILLGHSSVATTQKYLDLSLDLETTASDFIPLSGD